MRYQNHRESKPIAERQDEGIELHRGHRVEARRGLIEEKEGGLKGHRPRNGSPLFHAP